MEAEFDPKSRMAVLIARVSDPYKYKFPLRVGQFVEAKITGRNYKNLYIIERELIKNSNQVVTINKIDSTLKYQDINILRYIDDSAMIDSGLPANVLICTTNLDVMYNGMKIRINK